MDAAKWHVGAVHIPAKCGIEDSYTYNGEGLRTSQTISGTTNYLARDMTEGLPLILSDGTNSYIYGPDGLAVRGYAATTVRNERVSLALLAEWLIERGVTRPCEVTKSMFDAYQRAVFYMRKRNGEPLSFRAEERRLIPVRMFFRWLVCTNRILYNPASELRRGAHATSPTRGRGSRSSPTKGHCF